MTQTKRRRASAEPTTGRTKRTVPKKVEVISEESEEEESPPEAPPAKVGKKKDVSALLAFDICPTDSFFCQSDAAGPARRISQKVCHGSLLIYIIWFISL